MITKLRKLGEEAFVNIEHEEGDCAACKAGCHTQWTGEGVIFFEDERGLIRRVENVGFPVLAFLCGEVTREEALDELGVVQQFELEPLGKDTRRVTMEEMLPSSIDLNQIPPLTGTMERLECEAAATLMVRACVLNGDRWQVLKPQDIGAAIAHDLDNKLEPLWSLNTNPFWRPDFRALVARGFARWTTDEEHAPIEFTDKGLGALRAYSA